MYVQEKKNQSSSLLIARFAVINCTNLKRKPFGAAQISIVKHKWFERIIHYTSKDAMDLRGLGEANIRKFHE
jgi:NAD-dependent DNA ligase